MKILKTGLLLMMICSMIVSSFSISVYAKSSEMLNTFFVATDGNDENDGSIDAPFKTLEAARDAIRNLNKEVGLPNGGVCVYIRGGTYSRLKSFKLEEQDSGTIDSPITYRAYKDEKVEFIGGISLSVKDFLRVGDEAVLNRIHDRKAREFIYQYDLSDIENFEVAEMFFPGSFSNAGTKATPNELICDDEIMTIARWPNGDSNFSNVAGVISKAVEGKGFAFTTSDTSRANNWRRASDMRVYGFWRYDWADQCMSVDNIRNGIITTNTTANYDGPVDGARFYVFNLLEELDEPGEFYIDKETKILYFYPPLTSTADSTIYLSALIDPVFLIENASNITLRNFKVQATRGVAFQINGGENNLVAYNEIINAGGNAIRINAEKNSGAVGNYVKNCNGGITVSGGDRITLTPAGNYAENNHVEKWSRITKTYVGGFSVGGVGNRISHNKMHDALHLSMQFSGNENMIEFNEIYDVLQAVDDAGSIYAGNSWTWRGNKILNNYFHTMTGKSGGVGLGAIYCDDWLANVTISGNLFHNISGRGIWAEGGSDHLFTNNIMVDVRGPSVRIADRAADGTVYSENSTGKEKMLYDRLVELPYDTGIWAEMYPQLPNILKSNPGLPQRNVVTKNAIVNSGAISIGVLAEENGTVKDNETFTDPGFVDMANGDFRIKSNAEIYNVIKGFEDIQFEKMGMYTDRLNERIKNAIVLAANKAGAYINGDFKQIDESNDFVVPVIDNGRTLVPVRFISESIGAKVEWNAETQDINIRIGDKEIVMTIGNKLMTVNGRSTTLDVEPKVISGRTLIPLRALAEALDKQVFWDEKGLIVISDKTNTFDSKEDAYLIDELIRKVNLR